MLRAVEFEILRGLQAGSRDWLPLGRLPVRVATMIDEPLFLEEKNLIHLRTVFLEDRMHDWEWRNGQFRYFSRVGEVNDVVIVYRLDDVRYDPDTGEPTVVATEESPVQIEG